VLAWIHTLTVDASFSKHHSLTGIGIVVQERISPKRRRGPILDQIAESHAGVHPRDAEAVAVLRAIEIAHDRGYTRIKIRSDHNFMRRALRDHHRKQSGLDDPGIHGRILRLARTFEFVDFGLVRRRKNRIAHLLARRACGIGSRAGDRTDDPPIGRSRPCDGPAGASTSVGRTVFDETPELTGDFANQHRAVFLRKE
jgi:ribonuclease HI